MNKLYDGTALWRQMYQANGDIELSTIHFGTIGRFSIKSKGLLIANNTSGIVHAVERVVIQSAWGGTFWFACLCGTMQGQENTKAVLKTKVTCKNCIKMASCGTCKQNKHCSIRQGDDDVVITCTYDRRRND